MRCNKAINKVIKTTRIPHHVASITNIGTVVLPAPRITADIQCENANRKKNGAHTLVRPTPKAMTSGLLLNKAIRLGAKMVKVIPIHSARQTEQITPKRIPFSVRSF